MKKIITRQEAIKNNLKFYHTGKECLNGHTSDRNTANGRCRKCHNLTRRRQKQKLAALKYFNKYFKNRKIIKQMQSECAELEKRRRSLTQFILVNKNEPNEVKKKQSEICFNTTRKIHTNGRV